VEVGFPSPAHDHLERGIDLNEELLRNPAATFYVRVKGKSMESLTFKETNSAKDMIQNKSLEFKRSH
jgi:DNA polymerase V